MPPRPAVSTDGTNAADERLNLSLTNDTATGIMRYADAGYEESLDEITKTGINHFRLWETSVKATQQWDEMVDQSMRGLIAALEATGELHRVTRFVDPKFELGAVLKLRDRGPALLFERPGASAIPVVALPRVWKIRKELSIGDEDLARLAS